VKCISLEIAVKRAAKARKKNKKNLNSIIAGASIVFFYRVVRSEHLYVAGLHKQTNKQKSKIKKNFYSELNHWTAIRGLI